MKHALPLLPVGLALVLAHAARPASAQQEGVARTVHNLSVSGPGEVKALTETEVCKFCHVPHSPVLSEPLWGHALSRVSSYAVPQLRRGRVAVLAPQPDGSSRLCLSCHDGTVALGDLGPRRRVIPMAGSQHLEKGQRGFIGTDLSGSHPVSFVVPDGDPGGTDTTRDMGLRPLALVRSEGHVPLDSRGKMQCTTCHDPHSDRNYRPGRVPHFWNRPTVDEVCLACHELR
jgi:hypothetical protein